MAHSHSKTASAPPCRPRSPTSTTTAHKCKYDRVGITFEADQVVNRTYVEGLNGNNATDTDATSIATYFIQTDSITNSLLHVQAQIDAAAAYLLEPAPEARYTDVSTQFTMLGTASNATPSQSSTLATPSPLKKHSQRALAPPALCHKSYRSKASSMRSTSIPGTA
jgi:hypothetical protein